MQPLVCPWWHILWSIHLWYLHWDWFHENPTPNRTTGRIVRQIQLIDGLTSSCWLGSFLQAEPHTIQELVKDIEGNNLIQYGGIEKFEVGKGPLFGYRYNLTISWVALIIALGSVVCVGIYSFRRIKEHMESYEPESIL